MVAITQYTDDVAFFAAELADEIQSHAAHVREKLLKLTKEAPKVSTVDFSGPRESGLMPPRDHYESWLSGFKSQD
jgi:DNA-binding SARP family transcriptional activator